MSVNVRDVRKELATALGTINGLRVSNTIPESVNPPMAIVTAPDVVQYHQVMGRSQLTRLEMSVTVVLARMNERGAQESIDAYCSIGTPESIIDALEDNLPIANGAIKTLQVQQAEVFRSTENYIIIDFQVEVYA